LVPPETADIGNGFPPQQSPEILSFDKGKPRRPISLSFPGEVRLAKSPRPHRPIPRSTDEFQMGHGVESKLDAAVGKLGHLLARVPDTLAHIRRLIRSEAEDNIDRILP
jgi:hypothetical protein